MEISQTYMWTGIIMMAVVTYIIRALPVILFRKPVTNPFIKSFLYYVPYAVLTAMTIPAVFYSGTNKGAVILGVLAAGLTAFFGGSLLIVACVAAAVTYFGMFLF